MSYEGPWWRSNNSTFIILKSIKEIKKELFKVEKETRIPIRIGWSADTAILMCCIDLESSINMFCFFNLGEVTTEAIESINLLKKLEVAHSVLGLKKFKGSKPYECLKELTEWRNKFAHGKCSDMPKDSIRKNHLNSPEKYPNGKDYVVDLIQQVNNYLVVVKYLHTISVHEYTSCTSTETMEIEKILTDIQTIQKNLG